MIRGLLPRPLRRLGGRARATLVRGEVLAEVQRAARSGRMILAGPWLGEVGFEILYWTPFLRWLGTAFQIDATRMIAVSRGGTASWYTGAAARYIDVFDHVDVPAFRHGNQRRRLELGEQKQVRPSAFDGEVMSAIRSREQLLDAETIHPSLMYRLFQPFWWKHAGDEWIADHTTPARLPRPPLPAALGVGAGAYVAVKLYPNDCLPDDEVTRAFSRQTIAALAATQPVVTLDTGLMLDDHASQAHVPAAGNVFSIATLVTPATNLAVQSAVLANARAFVGTYGGFSYLPPMHGVPALGVYSRPTGFDRAHLRVAQQAFARIGAPRFDVRDVRELVPESVAAMIESLQ